MAKNSRKTTKSGKGTVRVKNEKRSFQGSKVALLERSSTKSGVSGAKRAGRKLKLKAGGKDIRTIHRPSKTRFRRAAAASIKRYETVIRELQKY